MSGNLACLGPWVQVLAYFPACRCFGPAQGGGEIQTCPLPSGQDPLSATSSLSMDMMLILLVFWESWNCSDGADSGLGVGDVGMFPVQDADTWLNPSVSNVMNLPFPTLITAVGGGLAYCDMLPRAWVGSAEGKEWESQVILFLLILLLPLSPRVVGDSRGVFGGNMGVLGALTALKICLQLAPHWGSGMLALFVKAGCSWGVLVGFGLLSQPYCMASPWTLGRPVWPTLFCPSAWPMPVYLPLLCLTVFFMDCPLPSHSVLHFFHVCSFVGGSIRKYRLCLEWSFGKIQQMCSTVFFAGAVVGFFFFFFQLLQSYDSTLYHLLISGSVAMLGSVLPHLALGGQGVPKPLWCACGGARGGQ